MVAVERMTLGERIEAVTRSAGPDDVPAMLEELEACFHCLTWCVEDPDAGPLASRLLREMAALRRRLGDDDVADELAEASLAVAVGVRDEREVAESLLDLTMHRRAG